MQRDEVDIINSAAVVRRGKRPVADDRYVRRLGYVLGLCVATALSVHSTADARQQWTETQATSWYARQPWMVGANYIPVSAVNELEMWQADTFDPDRIDLELGWAQRIGMNSMRVFLHDLLWEQDPNGFKRRISKFLHIAERHHIRVLFVLFDSCHNPNPQLGRQPPPRPGIHNSQWVQSPGHEHLGDPNYYPKLRAYVQGVVGAFASDPRIIGWDVWNEPDNPSVGADRLSFVKLLLPQVFDWVRQANPSQPVTSAIHWHDHDWTVTTLTEIERVQIENSDVVSFHDYSWPEEFKRRAQEVRSFGRPVICTEYMARSAGSTFDGSLPIGKSLNIGMLNWGFVDGKTQTKFPGDSVLFPYVGARQPTIWFHDVLGRDGTPYRRAEIELIRAMANSPKGVVPDLPWTIAER